MPFLGTRGSGSVRGYGRFGAGTPGAPQNVSVSVLNPSSVSVSFNAPSSNGGLEITSYTVTASPGGASTSGASSPITLGGLSASTAYTFTVTANNLAGSGAGANGSGTTPAFPVVTGGTLSSDSTYYYRTFTGNGTLAVSNSTLTCDVLIGAGGGGGGNGGSGGGSFTSNYSATAGSYNFVVGAAGNDSTGIGITAYRGGAGTGGTAVGNSGGSGSGASVGGAVGPRAGGAATKASGGTITYGNAGGSAQATIYFTGSGGGGGWGGGGGGGPENVGCPGEDCFGQGGGGGSGINTYNSWSSATGIGQLSGGTRWIGGGGGGSSQSGGPNGAGVGVNTSGVGSSGFVMVRYLKTAVA
jgi:hypothetical protein